MKYRYAKASESQRCRYVSYIYKSHNMIYRYAKASESQRCRYVSYIYKSKKYDTQVYKSFSHCGVTMFHTYIRVNIWYTRMQKVHSHIASYTSRVHTDLTWNKIGTTTCKWLECNTQRYTYTHIYTHTNTTFRVSWFHVFIARELDILPFFLNRNGWTSQMKDNCRGLQQKSESYSKSEQKWGQLTEIYWWIS